MKHEQIRWNPAHNEWFCVKCGRSSNHKSDVDAHFELNQFECSFSSTSLAVESLMDVECASVRQHPHVAMAWKEKRGL